MSGSKRAATLACALALGCGDAGRTPGERALPVELGTGVSEYEPLAKGGVLVVYRGPQGGYHALAGLRADWASVARPARVGASLRIDDEVVAKGGGRVPLERAADGGHTLHGLPVYFLSERVAERAFGQPAVLALELTDADGRAAAAELHVVCVAHLP